MLNIYKNKFCFLIIILSSTLAFASNNQSNKQIYNDVLFKAGFQSTSQPSKGKRGSYPGAFNRYITHNGKTHTYYISIPQTYNPNNPMPLLFTWHGAAGAGTAPTNAIAMRDFWRSTSEDNNFIVIAQAATGQIGGGWVASRDIPLLSKILNDMFSHYNIEKTRIYGHGFSSGGHVMHTLMLNNENFFAAYAVSAGVLEAQAGINAPFDALRKIPVFISVGTFDTSGPNLRNLSISNHQVFNNAGWSNNYNLWIDQFSGGHQIDSNLPQKAWDKISNFSNQD